MGATGEVSLRGLSKAANKQRAVVCVEGEIEGLLLWLMMINQMHDDIDIDRYTNTNTKTFETTGNLFSFFSTMTPAPRPTPHDHTSTS